MADYRNITPLTEREQEIMTKMGRSCPCCDLNWFFSPPTKIDGHSLVRCVQCKEVFEANTTGDPVGGEKL